MPNLTPEQPLVVRSRVRLSPDFSAQVIALTGYWPDNMPIAPTFKAPYAGHPWLELDNGVASVVNFEPCDGDDCWCHQP